MIFDPVMRAPLIGSILMALSASLVGVLLFVRKRTLIGETLAHASYPGVTLAVLSSAWISMEFLVLIGAFVFGLLGFFLVNFLKSRLKVKEDAALTFVLATFFGMGTLVASIVQGTHPGQFRQIQVFLYGQAATMTDGHIVLYASFSALVISALVLFYKPLLASSFDPIFAKTNRLAGRGIELLFISMVTLSVVIGIRSVGVIMMSALFIAPPIAARQFTNKLPKMFLLSALFGMTSGFVGTLLSLTGIPTGPMIVIVASTIALLALLFAPERGVIVRYFRIARFRYQSYQENQLKALWHGKPVHLTFMTRALFQMKGWIKGPSKNNFIISDCAKAPGVERSQTGVVLTQYDPVCDRSTAGLLRSLRSRSYFRTGPNQADLLTTKGERQGAKIVRLHRLWEAYLVYSLGMGVEQVHHSAEEMEHLLTKELEEELTKLLDNPQYDPHKQPIPPREAFS